MDGLTLRHPTTIGPEAASMNPAELGFAQIPPARIIHDGAVEARYGVSMSDQDIRSALIRQWELIAKAVPRIDLSRPSRIDGWSNREVLAHLYVQPRLVIRFLNARIDAAPKMRATTNLAATRAFSELVDSSAREGAILGKVNLGIPLAEARPVVLAADLDSTIETLQGSISVSDYLVTRWVEAVVHGGDLVDPVTPDSEAQSVASTALLDVLAASAPQLVAEAKALPTDRWIEIATGRHPATGHLAAVTPVMA